MNWIIITKYNMYFSIQEKEVEQRAQPLYIYQYLICPSLLNKKKYTANRQIFRIHQL